MYLPSKKVILGRLALLVLIAAGARAATSVYSEVSKKNDQQVAEIADEAESLSEAVWEDVNLATGYAPPPEDDISMARSKMFHGLEAR